MVIKLNTGKFKNKKRLLLIRNDTLFKNQILSVPFLEILKCVKYGLNSLILALHIFTKNFEYCITLNKKFLIFSF
jgi:hypothetical protein